MKDIVKIENIFKLSISKIPKLKHNLNILFQDGVILENVSYKSVIVFRCILDLYNKIDGIKLPSTLFIDDYLNLKYFNYDTYTKMYSVVLRQYVNDVVKKDNNIELINILTKEMFITMNNLPKHLNMLNDYVIGIEITDVFKIQFRDKLLKSMQTVSIHPTHDNIIKTYDELDNILVDLDDTDLIRLIYLSKMVNSNQLRQLFGSRGFVTEIDSSIFATPMSNSFTFGPRNIYDMGIESRSSSKASHMSHRAIQSSEYTARGLQLVTMVVESIWYGDCGNTDYIDFYVKPADSTYKGDLPNLIGKYYFNESTGKEDIILPENSNHLSGTTIKLRMVDNCKLPDKKRVCSKCFGDLAYSIFEHQNLGHICSTNPTRDTTQSLLGTKHLTKSATTSAVVLNKTLEQFFIVKFKDKLFLQRKYQGRKTKGLKLHIPQNQVRSFEKMVTNKDVMSINLDKVSWLYDITMEEYTNSEKQEDMFYPLEIKTSGRIGIFTNYFWTYLLKNGYTVDELDNYVVDLKDWDFTKPIIMYEKKEFDFAALGQQFSKLIKTRKYFKSGDVTRAEYTPTVLVEKLFDLLNSKLSINIALLEVLAYAFTARDISKDNYDLSRNSPNRELVGIKNAIDSRSVGASFGWNKLDGKIFDPYTFESDNKPDHPLDVLFKANEVIADIGVH